MLGAPFEALVAVPPPTLACRGMSMCPFSDNGKEPPPRHRFGDLNRLWKGRAASPTSGRRMPG
jgi:hypothetical protein